VQAQVARKLHAAEAELLAPRAARLTDACLVASSGQLLFATPSVAAADTASLVLSLHQAATQLGTCARKDVRCRPAVRLTLRARARPTAEVLGQSDDVPAVYVRGHAHIVCCHRVGPHVRETHRASRVCVGGSRPPRRC
jgi:hypothetical protein